ncbi:hypothetical protein G9A89_003325 [Geosiphon pyriformis]|nr:hypothetical protein G9A89_003325 [Geosiphon pyriformis]
MFDKNLAAKAAEALLNHVGNREKDRKGKDLLIQQRQTIWLTIGTKLFSEQGKDKPIKIPLRHALYGPDTEVCLFTKDPQKDFKELLSQHNVTRITKVISLDKLRKKYKQFEAKRQLCDAFELFLADERILHRLPKLLGKVFFIKKKQPIPVKLKSGDIKAEIDRACNSTYLHLSTGTCVAVKIGNVNHSVSQLLENLDLSVPIIVEKLPKKRKNIMSMQIKTGNSVSLPIYNAQLYNGTYNELAEQEEEPESPNEKPEAIEAVEARI